MKTSVSFILLFLLSISIDSIIVDAECWERPNPLKPFEKKISSVCGLQKKTKGKLTADVGKESQKDEINSLAAKEAFKFDFSCGVPDKVLCTKAENAFKAAGEIIANVIILVTPITVNATFTDFCKALNECDGTILGAASAARTIPLLDDDKVVRQYPQALAKQFLLDPTPKWGPFDIQAFFNAQADLFFKGDGVIKKNQFDFEYIILHELIHGLGFASAWNNYFSEQPVALTPDPNFLESITDLNQPVKFTGFEETAFDKYMINTRDKGAPKRMTEFTNEINSFAEIGTDFPSVQALLNTFADSKQFQTSSQLILDGQTPKTMAFQPRNVSSNDMVFLETNLKPFRVGSSISHVDIKSFNNDPDFLEVFNAKPGQTLEQVLKATGGKYPIGPKLKSVLETLGYATKENPNPYRPTLSNDSMSTPSNLPIGKATNDQSTSSATSLTFSFNILSLLVILAATLSF
ncbi:1626_t:CDS:1 [Funneliformis geosporum]|uniref:18106_t:CDS:1 n=1 Tax=Funneliformis geosporum TaxID=1117311 RepID=A0A9W4WQE9_9GLOM|nr:1626_t:CDS:1 [Funneliformis geosporum]CAI2178615.1 18106_t:CDS:1 [Funneliformis geosporum]